MIEDEFNAFEKIEKKYTVEEREEYEKEFHRFSIIAKYRVYKINRREEKYGHWYKKNFKNFYKKITENGNIISFRKALRKFSIIAKSDELKINRRIKKYGHNYREEIQKLWNINRMMIRLNKDLLKNNNKPLKKVKI